jgi:AbrB family looped-hinge helix DNA binding protein
MFSYKTIIGENGRIIIPAKIRKQANLLVGQSVIINAQNGELTIFSYQAKLKNIQEIIKSYTKYKVSLVNKLLELPKTE